MVDPPRTRTYTRSAALALLVLCLVGTPLATAATVSDLRVSGSGVLSDAGPNPTVAAWQSTTVTASVDAAGTEEVCVRAATPDRTVSLGCHRVENGTAATTVDAWPTNLSGRVTLVAAPRPNGTGGDRLEQTVSLLRAGDDADDDGLTNRVELDRGTDPTARDTDGDGIADGPEVSTYGTDPTARDTDGDNLADGIEVRTHGTDPTTADTDGDGLQDGPEVTIYGTDPTTADTDGDGIQDGSEVDDHGTDPTRADTDGDGLQDGPEVNVYDTDPTRADTDGDGLPDGPEVKQYDTDPANPDTDDDGFADGAEVDRYGTDPTQPNTATGGEDAGVDLPLVGTTPAVPSSLLAVLLAGLLLGAVGVVFAVSLWSSRDGDDAPPDTGDGDGGGDVPPLPDDVPAHPDAREVRALLDDNDGRLRQSEIVARTDWSKSKVSRVVSSMADADQVRKIRVGRENLVVLPGAEPEHATGPFED